jgi:hypothetical protein
MDCSGACTRLIATLLDPRSSCAHGLIASGGATLLLVRRVLRSSCHAVKRGLVPGGSAALRHREQHLTPRTTTVPPAARTIK